MELNLLAALDLTWPTAAVVIVLLLITLAMMMAALHKAGIDGALKLWGALGTFASAVVGALLGVTVGAQQADVQLTKDLRAQTSQTALLQDDLRSAEIALVSANLPAKVRAGTMPSSYKFKMLTSDTVRGVTGPMIYKPNERNPWMEELSKEQVKAIMERFKVRTNDR